MRVRTAKRLKQEDTTLGLKPADERSVTATPPSHAVLNPEWEKATHHILWLEGGGFIAVPRVDYAKRTQEFWDAIIRRRTFPPGMGQTT